MRLGHPKFWAAGGILALGFVVAMDRLLPPSLARFDERSVVVADRAGEPLRIFMSGDEKWRLLTRPRDVDPLYLKMLKAYEDKRFDSHLGFDPAAGVRAVGQALANGKVVSGASTLTMQAIRLLEPRPRTVWSKAIEILRAGQLEARLRKEEVLSVYLTLAPFGGPVEGVRAASLKLFGREPKMLTPAEAALLVALPQSPNQRRPDRHPEAAKAARTRVLDRVYAAGVITATERRAAISAPLPNSYLAFPFQAPHLASRLRQRSGGEGWIETTIDRSLQQQVQDRLKAGLMDHPVPTTAAAIIIDAKTAEVRAHIGGPNFFDVWRSGMLDMTTAVRSPGSTLKPFIYGLAFDRLLARPETMIADRPFREKGYAPANFNGGFAGDVTMSDALVRSLNIPAVKVLARLGPSRFDSALATAGITLDYDREGGDAGLALALGGVGVDLETLARAYVAFTNAGMVPNRLVFMPGQPVQWRAFVDTAAAQAVHHILGSAPPPAGRSGLSTGLRSVAYKTGTSYGYRDALAVGIVGDYVIAIWVGRPDRASCVSCVGIVAAAPILFDIAGLLPQTDARPPTRTGLPVPPHLRHFDRLSRDDAAYSPSVEIRFPVDGAALRLGGSGRAPLVAAGGKPPYRWLADGDLIGTSVPGATRAWRPKGGGFHELLVLDAGGSSAKAKVFIQR
ncbi:MAG: penicillin-binding protein 1C [Alphaproteobacteria bacterium]